MTTLFRYHVNGNSIAKTIRVGGGEMRDISHSKAQWARFSSIYPSWNWHIYRHRVELNRLTDFNTVLKTSSSFCWLESQFLSVDQANRSHLWRCSGGVLYLTLNISAQLCFMYTSMQFTEWDKGATLQVGTKDLALQSNNWKLLIKQLKYITTNYCCSTVPALTSLNYWKVSCVLVSVLLRCRHIIQTYEGNNMYILDYVWLFFYILADLKQTHRVPLYIQATKFFYSQSWEEPLNRTHWKLTVSNGDSFLIPHCVSLSCI